MTHKLDIAVLTLLSVSLFAACSTEPRKPDAKELAIRDYVDLVDLEAVSEIRYDNSSRIERLDNNRYIIYITRRGDFLIEFRNPCWDLFDNTRVEADVRFEANRIRVRQDTLRGCPIQDAWLLTEDQAKEIREIGEAPTGG